MSTNQDDRLYPRKTFHDALKSTGSTNRLSNCCSALVLSRASDEGTGFYTCGNCGNACDAMSTDKLPVKSTDITPEPLSEAQNLAGKVPANHEAEELDEEIYIEPKYQQVTTAQSKCACDDEGPCKLHGVKLAKFLAQQRTAAEQAGYERGKRGAYEHIKRIAGWRNRTDYEDGTTWGDTTYAANDAGYGHNEAFEHIESVCDKSLAALQPPQSGEKL